MHLYSHSPIIGIIIKDPSRKGLKLLIKENLILNVRTFSFPLSKVPTLIYLLKVSTLYTITSKSFQVNVTYNNQLKLNKNTRKIKWMNSPFLRVISFIYNFSSHFKFNNGVLTAEISCFLKVINQWLLLQLNLIRTNWTNFEYN